MTQSKLEAGQRRIEVRGHGPCWKALVTDTRGLEQIAVAVALAGLGAGCAPEDLQPQTANAEVYARAYCEDLCAKHEECAPVPESYGECTVERCLAEFVEEEGNPCFPLAVETPRCFLERESCEEFFDGKIDSTPTSVCYDVIVAWTECEFEHQDDS